MKKLLHTVFAPLLICSAYFFSSVPVSGQTTRKEVESFTWNTSFGNFTGGWNIPVNVAAMSNGGGIGPSGSTGGCVGSLRGAYANFASLGLANGTYNFTFGFYDNNTSVNNSTIWAMIGPESKNTSISDPPSDPGGMLLVNSFPHTGTTTRGSFTSTTYTNIKISQTDAIFLIPCADGSSSDIVWDYIDITPTYPNLNNPVIPNGQTLTINENNCIGAVAGTVSASDADMPAALDHSLTYSITAGNTGNMFTINPTTGQLKTNGVLDFETKSSYPLTIQVSDNGTPAKTTTNTVTVNVGNIVDVTNNTPVMNNQTLPSVAENSSFGTVAGTVVASDPDAGQWLRYSIIGGNTGNVFMFNGNQLIVNGALDYETKNSYALTVQVADNACPTQTKTATITVNVSDVVEVPSGLCTSLTSQGNLVTNGDFEGSVNSSYSDYSFNSTTCASGPGTWGISLPISCRSSYAPATKNGVASDASGNTNGHYMLIDADDNTSAVWKSQPITVTGGVTYYFSAWIANINNSYRNPSELNFLIGSSVINASTLIKANTADHEWSQYYTTWTAPSNATITLSFKNISDDGSGSGDDMALDNITFSGSCQFISAFRTSKLPVSIDNCTSSAVTLNSLVPSASTTFSWTKNGTTVAGAAGPSLTTGAGSSAFGRYVLCYTKSGCSIQDTVDVLMCPLPVVLTDFLVSGQGNVHLVRWSTSSEKNNAHFIIERSSNGTDFTEIGSVSGYGNSNTMRSYAFTDEAPLRSTNYYRLKQVDQDGNFTYSEIKTITGIDFNEVTVYPNPNNGSFSIHMRPSDQSFQLGITDVEGRVVYEKSASAVPELLEVSDLPKGLYIVRLFLENEVVVKKVLVF